MKVTALGVSLAGTMVASLLGAIAPAIAQNTTPAAADWRADWELAEGLTIEIDTSGYNLPSHIMFVPDPGPQPKDPLYFVLELKGKVKVVTNDRSVHTFAENILPVPQGPTSFDQVGLTGLCLDPDNGYVFTTFAYLDSTQIYRNGMARFTTTPGTFGLEETDRLLFLDLFRKERSATSHQIGPCQVRGGHVYAAVGYGDEKAQAQNLHTTLGSIIRTTFDFKPVSDNPFYQDDGQDSAIDYIWAYGFRNVFGLKFVGNRLFATENGGDIDRFNEIEKGGNYLWNGTDWSIGARAAQSFAPAIGIVHLDFIPRDNDLFPPEYSGQFASPTSGLPGGTGRGEEGSRSLLLLNYDFELKRMASVPKPILNFRGDGMQIPVSVSLGPDGLYFLPILPNSAGNSAVYRITYDPESNYPYRIGADQSPLALINQYGCRQCHSIAGAGGNFGPALGKSLLPRLTERLDLPAYTEQVAEVDKLASEPFAGLREVRQEILAVSGEARARRWLPAYLQEPTFDNPSTQMPRLDVSVEHAAIIAEHLLRQESGEAELLSYGMVDKLRFYIAGKIPELRYRHVAMSFVLGGVLATLFLIALYSLFRRRLFGR